MRLLRLTTDNPNAIFDTNFNDNIIVKPNAKVAVRNVSAELDSAELTITSYNNGFTYQIQTAAGARTVRLPIGTWDKNTFDELLDDMEFALNQSSSYDTGTPSNFYLGIEWNIGTYQDTKKMGIQFAYGIHAFNQEELNYQSDITSTPGAVEYSTFLDPTEANTDSYQYNILAKSRLSQGNGYIRTRIGGLVRDDAAYPQGVQFQGFVIGLSTTDLTALEPTEFTEDMITYGLGLSWDGTGDLIYYQQQKDVFTTDTVNRPNYLGNNDLDNDFIEVMKNGNKIQLRRYKTGVANPDVLFSHTLTSADQGLTYYPFIIFHGNANNCDINSIRWTPSPFIELPTDFVRSTQDEDTTLNIFPPYNKRTQRTQVYIEFEDLSTAKFLGYTSKRQPSSGLAQTNEQGGYNWVSQQDFKPQVVIDSFMVELLNIPVQSYDSSQRQRKNLLATLIKSDDRDIIDFTLGDVYIDLDNQDAINMKNIKLRIVGTDYSTINIKGTAVITLLVED